MRLFVPPLGSRAAYEDRAEFADTVMDGRRLREVLAFALRGKGAVRRFKDALSDRESWFRFANERSLRRAVDWLAEQGYHPAGH
ncbi:MAG TPA: UPF0158 family protein [Candidatus Dormibacteraeota bacterium]|nr:UPF0158 family protein [Candidatus Dormibacteraeota bacterium]